MPSGAEGEIEESLDVGKSNGIETRDVSTPLDMTSY